MAEYLLSTLADRDIAEIADYTISEFGIEQARHYLDELKVTFNSLANNPYLGRAADELAPDLRRHEHRSHVVFYVPNDEGVLIVRVIHQNRDFKLHF